MRSGSKNLLTIAFALSSVLALPTIYAAEAPASAPEKIEFSTSSTEPNVPRPNARKDEMLNRFRELQQGSKPGIEPNPVGLPPVTSLPSKAAQEKMMREMDRKRNWAVPGAQDREEADPLARGDFNKDGWAGGDEKQQSVMEKYFNGGDTRKRQPGDPRNNAPGHEFERRDERMDRRDSFLGDGKKKDRDERDARDPNDNSESNGLAAFDLKSFIRAQNSNPAFLKDNELPKASDLFRSEIGAARSERSTEKEIAEQRTRDATRSAEFMQILRPNGGGVGTASGTLVFDPINSPDQTRREMNPIVPRASELPTRSPFESPSSSGPRPPENNMFGVTGPAASSLAPSVSAPIARPEPARFKSIIIAPPKSPIN